MEQRARIFKKHYGDHSIDATAVFELQNQQDFQSDLSGMDITLAQYKWYNIEAALQNQTISSNFWRTQMLSYVGRVQYGYKDRYLLSLTARSDGASQLTPDINGNPSPRLVLPGG